MAAQINDAITAIHLDRQAITTEVARDEFARAHDADRPSPGFIGSTVDDAGARPLADCPSCATLVADISARAIRAGAEIRAVIRAELGSDFNAEAGQGHDDRGGRCLWTLAHALG